MVFFLFSILLALAALVENRSFYNISFIVVLVWFCFNYGYGFDWINYRDAYMHSLDRSAWFGFVFLEPGFLILMKIFRFMEVPFSLFYCFVSFFLYSMVYFFCRSQKNPSLSFFTLFSFCGFFAFSEWIREGMAISLILVGLIFLKAEKKNKFYIFVCMASMVHVSALTSFIYPYILKNNHKRMKRSVLIVFLIYSVIIFSFYNSQYFMWIPGISAKIAGYGAVYIESNQSGFFNYILSSKISFIYMLLLFFISFLNKKGASIYSSFKFVFLRLGYYFVPTLVISIDDFMDKQGTGRRTNMIKCIYIIIVLVISAIPLANPFFSQGISLSLDLFSTSADINYVISKKCNIINNNLEQHTILRCL